MAVVGSAGGGAPLLAVDSHSEGVVTTGSSNRNLWTNIKRLDYHETVQKVGRWGENIGLCLAGALFFDNRHLIDRQDLCVVVLVAAVGYRRRDEILRKLQTAAAPVTAIWRKVRAYMAPRLTQAAGSISREGSENVLLRVVKFTLPTTFIYYLCADKIYSISATALELAAQHAPSIRNIVFTLLVTGQVGLAGLAYRKPIASLTKKTVRCLRDFPNIVSQYVRNHPFNSAAMAGLVTHIVAPQLIDAPLGAVMDASLQVLPTMETLQEGARIGTVLGAFYFQEQITTLALTYLPRIPKMIEASYFRVQAELNCVQALAESVQTVVAGNSLVFFSQFLLSEPREIRPLASSSIIPAREKVVVLDEPDFPPLPPSRTSSPPPPLTPPPPGAGEVTLQGEAVPPQVSPVGSLAGAMSPPPATVVTPVAPPEGVTSPTSAGPLPVPRRTALIRSSPRSVPPPTGREHPVPETRVEENTFLRIIGDYFTIRADEDWKKTLQKVGAIVAVIATGGLLFVGIAIGSYGYDFWKRRRVDDQT